MLIKFIKIYKKYINKRIDNFLFFFFKKINKNNIYYLIRKGKIKINKKNIKSNYKLKFNDIIQIPFFKYFNKNYKYKLLKYKLNILYEDNYLLLINKPINLAVHGGTKLKYNLLQQLKLIRKDLFFLELIHRLDKNTSGIILIAKKKKILNILNFQIRNGLINKFYLTLIYGLWNNKYKFIQLYLKKKKKKIFINKNGKFSYTIFSLIKKYKKFTLIKAELKTGKTHQIRVHLSYIGYPIIGDNLYGNNILNKKILNLNFRNIILHSYKLYFFHPKNKKKIIFKCNFYKNIFFIFNKIKNL